MRWARSRRAKDELRTPIEPGRGDHMETLAIDFPVVDGTSAVMRIHRGETLLAVPLEVRGPEGRDADGGG